MAIRYLSGILVLLGALAGGRWIYGLLRSDRAEERYRIELLFRSARGLREGASVLYRGLRVGEVRSIRLAPEGEHASVDLALEPGAERTVSTATRFWIVTPRFQGMTGGATGLDTLIKDSYVAYVTPAPTGAPIPAGSRIPGSEDPPEELDPTLDAPQPGDLLFAVVFARTHGLKPGCRVRYRGIATGEVRRVDLTADGKAVVVEARIRRRHRTTLTTRSQLWVARPRLEGAMLSGFAVEELDALLEPYLAYHLADEAPGQPVADGARLVGLDASPTIPQRAPSTSSLEAPESSPPPASLEQRLVRVLYQCTEVDTSSRDDEISVSGTGVLFRDGQGRPAVLAPRSLTDGAWFLEDGWLAGEPDIANEQIQVQFSDGSVHVAGRAWVAPDGSDLSLLLLPPELESRAPAGDAPLDFGAAAPGTTTRSGELLVIAATGSDGGTERMQAGEVDGTPELSGVDLARFTGALILRGSRVIGFVGRSSAHAKTAKAVLLSEVPPALRPAAERTR